MFERFEAWRESAGDGRLDSPPESWLVTGSAITVGVVTRRTLMATWKRWRGTPPPHNPAAADVTWPDALIWAASVGAAVGVARVLSRRGVTAALRRVDR
jgi:Protein of unknown function (DUF4235)